MLVPGSMPSIILSFFNGAFTILVPTTLMLLVNFKINNLYSLFKISITVVAVFFICKQVFHKEQFENFINVCLSAYNDTHKCIMLLTVLLLMIVNWSFESVKWIFLLRKEIAINYLTGCKGVLIGVALSFFTPNRVGEFIGRVVVLPEKNRVNGALAAIAASLSQLIVTLVSGFISLIFLLPELSNFSKTTSWALVGSSIMVGLPLIYFYLNIHLVSRISVPFIKKDFLKRYLDVYETYTRSDLLKAGALSTFRYIVFTIQYVLIFRITGIENSFIDLFLATSVIFLIMTVLPTIAFFEPALRGSVSVFVMQGLTDNVSAILLSSYAIWLVNLVIPSLSGSLVFLNEKFFGRRYKV